MKTYFCMKCMRQRDQEETLCPVCGNIHGQEKNPDGVLPIGSVTGGQYMVGGVEEEDEWSVTYAALDLSRETPVTLKEFFPKVCAVRSGSDVSWTDESDSAQKMLERFRTVLEKSPEGASILTWFSDNGTMYCVENRQTSSSGADTVQHVCPDSAFPSSEGETVLRNTEPAVKEAHAAPGGKKKPVALIGAAAVLVLLLGWCGINHAIGGKNMDKGAYPAAVSSYKKDFLFGGKLYREAARLAGEDAFTQRDYVTAADYFALLSEEGAERWGDSIYAQARVLTENGSPEEAITLLESMVPEERVEVQIGVAQLEIAKKLYKEGNTREALDTAEAIRNRSAADVVGFTDTVHSETAKKCLRSGDIHGAIDEYGLCANVPEASVNADILQSLMRKTYCAAADKADAAILDGTTDFSRSEWKSFFENNMTLPNSFGTLAEFLDHGTALSIIGGEFELDRDAFRQTMTDHYEVSTMVTKLKTEPGDKVAIPDINEFYAQCGTAAAGKVIFVIAAYDFPDRNLTYAVDLFAMEQLPPRYRPRDLSEVEHVILTTYDFNRTGSYTRGTIAVREKTYTEAFKMPGKSRVWQSGQKLGQPAPSSFTYYLIPPDYKSGGVPNMGDAIADAFKAVYK